MPIYDFHCGKCEEDKTMECGITEYEEKIWRECPDCGTLIGEGFYRVYDSMNFILRGSGWGSKGQNDLRRLSARNKRIKEKLNKIGVPDSKIRAKNTA